MEAENKNTDIKDLCGSSGQSRRNSSGSIGQSSGDGGAKLFELSEKDTRPAAISSRSEFPIPDQTDVLPEGWEDERSFHESLFGEGKDTKANNQGALLEEIKTTPLFSAKTLLATKSAVVTGGQGDLLPSYGLLAKLKETYGGSTPTSGNDGTDDSAMQDERLFLNTNAPWSTFICGSQGSGKSHTLSCILENAILDGCRLGELPRKLTGMVFHYDQFTSSSSSQVCEAVYLCSKGIPVTVVVSPTNFRKMSMIYDNLEGIPAGMKPTVAPFLLEPEHLNVERMKKLMAMDNSDGSTPLYMEIVYKILRQMAGENEGAPGFDYDDFKGRLQVEEFNSQQLTMIKLRLQLLEDFMVLDKKPGTPTELGEKPVYADTSESKQAVRDWYDQRTRSRKAGMAVEGIWSYRAGSLTIVDLSCPFVNESFACTLFNMCLSIFLEDRQDIGRIVALDEAHKFMSEDANAATLTQTLLSVIRQQRHLATRVVIATQEPTISPKLLDLSTMTIVHRFSSPDWLSTLKAHLAGAAYVDEQEIFKAIDALHSGEALLFSQSAIMDLGVSSDAQGNRALKAQKLGMRYIKIEVRKRLTADGGRSIMAA